MPSPSLPPWNSIQARFADLPGAEGIERRRDAYAPYFLRMGRGVRIDEGCRFLHPGRIELDDDARINVGALVYGSGGVRIGRHARLGPRVFIHSANHDVAEGELAFFERGYVYRRVEIGDNCLVSANVSILPGAVLGAGTFVACGAVVTADRFPDDARLRGVPARVETAGPPPSCAAAPDIGLLVGASAADRAAAELLVGGLGLPQVAVLGADDPVPPSVHTVLRLADVAAPDGVTTWTMAPGDLVVDDAMTVRLPGGSDGETRVELPARWAHRVVLVPDESAAPLARAARRTLYYAQKRLRKRRPGPVDRLDVYLALLALHRFGGPRAVPAAAAFAAALAAPEETDLVDGERELLDAVGGGACPARALEAAPDLVFRLMRAGPSVRAQALERPHEAFTARALGDCPELSVGRALLGVTAPEPDGDPSVLVARAAGARAVACVGLAALLADRAEAFDAAVERLTSAPLFDARAGLARTAPDRPGWCYAPVAAALLLVAHLRREPDADVEVERTIAEALPWRLLAAPPGGSAWGATAGPASGAIVDPERRTVSRSLLEHWLRGHAAPELGTAQYELDEACYARTLDDLEAAWLALFRRMQHDAGAALLRVRPWPYPARAALSVRYDIDRETPLSFVHRAIETQCRLNGACGTWFAIPGSPHGAPVLEQADRALQERGVHGLRATGPADGRGVTMHSAPDSEYWRGAATLDGLEAAGATYGENLAVQLGRPRPVWRDGAAASLWALPIHFPLEGSTRDEDLSYFDRLRPEFRDLLAAGGHVILGTHPDHREDLLARLVEREDLGDAWVTTIERAVERCRRLLTCGAVVACAAADGGRPRIVGRATVADVRVEVYPPDGAAPYDVCVQLQAGFPRAVPAAGDASTHGP